MRRALLVSLVLALLSAGSPFAAAAQDGVLRVGSAAAKRGEFARGAIEVAAGVDAGLTIPVAVVNAEFVDLDGDRVLELRSRPAPPSPSAVFRLSAGSYVPEP